MVKMPPSVTQESFSIIKTSFFSALVIVTLFFAAQSTAQGNCIQSNAGLSFIAVFMQTPQSLNKSLTLYAGSLGKPVNISVSLSNLSSTIQIGADKQEVIRIPPQFELTNGEVSSRVIQITANDSITIVGHTEQPSYSEAYLALPVTGLGRMYFVFSYAPNQGSTSGLALSQFAVAATDDNTQVTVTLSTLFGGIVQFRSSNYSAGNQITFTLNRLQALQLQSTSDLTGTEVTANNRIAVWSGNLVATLGGQTENHVVEQMVPVETVMTSSTFAVAPLPGGRPYTVKVVAANPNTTVNILTENSTLAYPNVVNQFLPRRGDFLTWYQPSKGVIISATSPVSVCQFTNSSASPAMAVVPSISRFLSQYKFIVPTNVSHNFSTFTTILTADNKQLLYDNYSFQIGSQIWENVPGSTYEVGSLTTNLVGLAVHRIESRSNPPILEVSVFGWYAASGLPSIAYLYPAGMCLDGLGIRETPIPTTSTTTTGIPISSTTRGTRWRTAITSSSPPTTINYLTSALTQQSSVLRGTPSRTTVPDSISTISTTTSAKKAIVPLVANQNETSTILPLTSVATNGGLGRPTPTGLTFIYIDNLSSSVSSTSPRPTPTLTSGSSSLGTRGRRQTPAISSIRVTSIPSSTTGLSFPPATTFPTGIFPPTTSFPNRESYSTLGFTASSSSISAPPVTTQPYTFGLSSTTLTSPNLTTFLSSLSSTTLPSVSETSTGSTLGSSTSLPAISLSSTSISAAVPSTTSIPFTSVFTSLPFTSSTSKPLPSSTSLPIVSKPSSSSSTTSLPTVSLSSSSTSLPTVSLSSSSTSLPTVSQSFSSSSTSLPTASQSASTTTSRPPTGTPTYGNNFVVPIQKASSPGQTVELYMVNSGSSTVQVDIAYMGSNYKLTIPPNGNNSLSLNPPTFGPDVAVAIINASSPISMTTLLRGSCSAYLPLTNDALGTEYQVITWNASSSLSITAPKQQTTVRIRFPSRSCQIKSSNVTFFCGDDLTILLAPASGKLFTSMSDLSGTYVHSDVPVSVLAGSPASTTVGTGNVIADAMASELFPVYAWGQTFGVPPAPDNDGFGYFLKISSGTRPASINITYENNFEQYSILADGYVTVNVSGNQPVMIVSGVPIQVMQFVKSATTGGSSRGAPASLTIPAIERYTNFYSFGLMTFFTNFIAVVIDRAATADFRLNNQAVPPTTPSLWRPVGSTGSPLVTRAFEISEGSYGTVSHPTAKFGAFRFSYNFVNTPPCEIGYPAGALFPVPQNSSSTVAPSLLTTTVSVPLTTALSPLFSTLLVHDCSCLNVSTALQPSYNGYYYMHNRTLSDQPVYRRNDCELYLFLFKGSANYWVYGPSLGMNRGMLINSAIFETPEETVLWEGYNSSATAFEIDPSYNDSCSCPATVCASVEFVNANGSSIFDGVFAYQKTTINGRPIYKHQSIGIYVYYWISDICQRWMVGASVGSDSGVLYADDHGLDAKDINQSIVWRYFENARGFVAEPDIDLRCYPASSDS